MNKQINPFAKMEEDVLAFWEKNQIFEKSLKKEAPKGDYVFYDGPPFATGTPHYGHIVASIMKDVIPRYWTMQGKRVERKWGWDCHGLPIENIVEKELGSKSKKDIEEHGVAEFNELCRSKVLSYVDEWKRVIRRLGRWVDMENAYKTMDLPYMESIWWVFKQLWDKGLIYKGYRSMHICPRCETTLSQSEVTEGYKNIKDLSATAKFELLDEPGTFVLAWTTTPWTLIGNVALAVGENIDYLKIKKGDEKYILAKDLAEKVLKDEDYEVLKEFKGKNLLGKKYKPLFDYYVNNEKISNKENGWKIYRADFVTTEDGTGVVHIAPAFGEDDMNLGKKHNLPFIQHVSMDGYFKKEVKDFAGLNVKPKENHMATDIEIIKHLAHKNLLFDKEKYEHSYPHCWRCDTPLLNYATSSWFVNVTKIKKRALETAKAINWSPAHIKEGRFGKWLEGARDWSISRQRFWASVMPIWECSCGNQKVLGSVAELEELSGEKVTDLHKHIVDKITFKCDKCGGEMHRISDVLDTWFDSGSMPYAQMHYPFENKEKFEKNFPAEFIAEGQDQTRAWFYYLHIIATAIKDSNAFQNVIVNGIVLAEDGKKMSKKLKNYPDPSLLFDEFGVDALRYYLMTSHITQADNLNFSKDGVKEALRKVVMILWNVVRFYDMFSADLKENRGESNNVLDKWILAKLNKLSANVKTGMEEYNLPKASRGIADFVDDLSTWYIRRSRDRFKGSDEQDKQNALNTTKEVLITLSKLIAPFMPFMAENIWQKVKGYNFEDPDKSVHLEAWPESKNYDENILKEMKEIRKIVELGLAERDKAGIKIRQPLSELKIENFKLKKEYEQLILDELNIKKVISQEGSGELKVALNTKINKELEQEGLKREVVRQVNILRKKLGLVIGDTIKVYYLGDDEIKEVIEKYKEELKKDTISSDYINQTCDDCELSKKVKLNGREVEFFIAIKGA